MSYSLEVLVNIITSNNAKLTTEYTKTNRETKINFLCACGKEGSKSFVRLVISGALCVDCTNKARILKSEQTNLVKYGTKCTFQCPSVKQKIRETCLRPTNIQNGHLWCPVLYDLSALRPCDTIKNGHKVPIFNVHGSKKYGTTNPLASKEIQGKIAATNIDRYGVSNPYAAKEIIQKIRETCKIKYGTEFPTQTKEVSDKRIKTNLERYGTEVSSKAESVKEKSRQTNIILYGIPHHTTTPSVVEKSKATILDKYGVEHTFQSEDVKEKIKTTMLSRYGVTHNMQLEKCVAKTKQTFLVRYGVTHPLLRPTGIRNRHPQGAGF